MLKLMKGLGGDYSEDYVLEKEESKRVGLLREKVVTKEAVMYSTLARRDIALPNIISYDFVNEETNTKIIALNDNGLQAVPEDI